MVVTISWRLVAKRVKLCIKVVVLMIIMFYILPKLISLFWGAKSQELKLREQHMLEKPLRVSTQLIDNG